MRLKDDTNGCKGCLGYTGMQGHVDLDLVGFKWCKGCKGQVQGKCKEGTRSIKGHGALRSDENGYKV